MSEHTATVARPRRRRPVITPARLVEAIMLVVIAAAMLLAMASSFRNRGYVADDVAFQLIYDRLWREGKVDVWTDVDTFLIKAPVDLIAIRLFGYTRQALFAMGVVCALVELAGVALVTHLTARLRDHASVLRTVIAYVPALAFFAISMVPYAPDDPSAPTFNNAVQLLNVNGRNAEIGLGLMALAGLAALAEHERARPRALPLVLFGLGGLASGLLLYSDQFYQFALFGTVLAGAVLLWLMRRVSWRVLAGALVFTVLSRITFRALQSWGHAVGIHQVKGKGYFAMPDKVVDGLVGAIHSVFRQVHGDLSGMDYSTHPVIIVGLNAVVAALLFATLIWVAARVRRASILEILVALSAGLTLVAFAFSDRGGNVELSRYAYPATVMLVSLAGAATLWLWDRLSTRRLAGALALALLASTALNARFAALVSIHPSHPNPQGQTNEIIRIAREHGITKGYGGYWESTEVTFLSGHDIVMVPTGCIRDQQISGRFFWLNDRADITRPTSSSFLLVPDRDLGQHCMPERRSGTPTDTIPLGDGNTLFLFDHDIGQDWPIFNYEIGGG